LNLWFCIVNFLSFDLSFLELLVLLSWLLVAPLYNY
jgi:hypothetical protein